MQFSDYIIYVDESGDHNLKGINPSYPMFVLAFCIFKKSVYSTNISPALQNLKFNYFGQDTVILHEREILKSEGAFKEFNKEKQTAFLSDISQMIENSDFTIVACAIKKDEFIKTHKHSNIYHLALEKCLDFIYQFLKEKEQLAKLTHIVFECRGKKEDQELIQAFNTICQTNNYPFSIRMAHKNTNLAGLQFADLIARPIGNHILRPTQANQAMDIIHTKLFLQDIIVLPK